MAHISDSYPPGYCICAWSYDEACHIHGTEGCLGCAVHPDGRPVQASHRQNVRHNPLPFRAGTKVRRRDGWIVTCTKCGVMVDPELLALVMTDAKVIVSPGLPCGAEQRVPKHTPSTCGA
jgi:hypothetical protein